MPKNGRTKTKGGYQICTVFPEGYIDRMDRILDAEKKWMSQNDFIREALKAYVDKLFIDDRI